MSVGLIEAQRSMRHFIELPDYEADVPNFITYMLEAKSGIQSFSEWFTDFIKTFGESQELLKAYDTLSKYYYGTFLPIIEKIDLENQLGYVYTAQRLKEIAKQLLNDLKIISDYIYILVDKYNKMVGV